MLMSDGAPLARGRTVGGARMAPGPNGFGPAPGTGAARPLIRWPAGETPRRLPRSTSYHEP